MAAPARQQLLFGMHSGMCQGMSLAAPEPALCVWEGVILPSLSPFLVSMYFLVLLRLACNNIIGTMRLEFKCVPFVCKAATSHRVTVARGKSESV